LTVFSLNALRQFRGQYMRMVRRRVTYVANQAAKSSQQYRAEQAVTRRMRY
jgi:hypothetical protein